MGKGKPRGLNAARKLQTNRRENRWADLQYVKNIQDGEDTPPSFIPRVQQMELMTERGRLVDTRNDIWEPSLNHHLYVTDTSLPDTPPTKNYINMEDAAYANSSDQVRRLFPRQRHRP